MISVSAGYGTDGSSTPTTVALREPRRMVLPITVGSLLSDVRPEAMGQDRRAGAASGPSSAGVEQAAEHRAQAHHLEVRAADDAGLHHARLAEADQREVDRREIAEGADRGRRAT